MLSLQANLSYLHQGSWIYLTRTCSHNVLGLAFHFVCIWSSYSACIHVLYLGTKVSHSCQSQFSEVTMLYSGCDQGHWYVSKKLVMELVHVNVDVYVHVARLFQTRIVKRNRDKIGTENINVTLWVLRFIVPTSSMQLFLNGKIHC